MGGLFEMSELFERYVSIDGRFSMVVEGQLRVVSFCWKGGSGVAGR